jgi:antitoxin component YwqK of YwqJK toxin-antitoxin module
MVFVRRGKAWYENGNLEYEHSYVHGEKHGICKWWYESGNLSYESTYVDGNLHGIYKKWDENVNLNITKY